MITEVKIQNFRGVEKCEISDLSLINFFTGKNNSGKSTILDAIFIASKEPLGFLPFPEILRKRAYREVGASELFFAYDANRKVGISLKSKLGDTYTLSFYINEKPTAVAGHNISPGNLISQFGDLGLTWYSSILSRGYGFTHPPLEENFRKYCEGAKFFSSSILGSMSCQES